MVVYRRTIAAAAAGLAAAGAVTAAAVAASHSGAQHAAPAADVRAAPAVGRPSAAPGAYLARLRTVRTIGSTVPSNGDVNPYGIVVLQHSAGRLHAGNVLVSNYNDKANLQGTGSTIVQITPRGKLSVFARITKAMLPSSGSCPGGIGLSTALVTLPGGWVVVGSAPSANGQAATAKAGCLIVLDNQGRLRETLHGDGINGPWDATAVSTGKTADLFVTNAFNGTAAGKGTIVRKGTVVRIALRLSGSAAPRLAGAAIIATGLAEQASAAAFVLGPTGVGLGRGDILYVADTATSTITAIPGALHRNGSAGPGLTITAGGSLSQPLGLAIASDGDILTVNGGNGKIVETTPAGRQVATELLDNSGSPAGAGALFGLTVASSGNVYYVDDVANTLRLLR
ncbi:MAG: hypothetical protein JO345_37015 [Streptosporangiaceae bacterium]|nr:hypothetical protein [Streptosporangiaceae bacterium]